MKKILITILAVFICNVVYAKDMSLTLSYGDVSADVEDTNAEATGWRVDVVGEMHPNSGNILQGFGVGYIQTDGDETVGAQTYGYKLKSLPIYYQPKYVLGKKMFKGFLKGALGIHFSDYKVTGPLGSANSNDIGLYAGASVGGSVSFKRLFVNVEYEWDFLSNSYYRDSLMQSIILGIGFKM